MSKKKTLTYILIICLYSLSILNTPNSYFVAKATDSTTLYVNPTITITQIGANFSVNISVTAVSDLCSWQVYIYYLKQILEAKNCTEGPFLKSQDPQGLGRTMFDGDFDNNHNATHGELLMYCLRMWSGKGANGSGTLASATFKGKGGGNTPLHLDNTELNNSTAQPISYITADGVVEVGIHDVAIKKVTPLKTIVGQGLTMRIEVTAENQGNYTENLNVTAYANTTQIATQEVTLNSGANTTITCIWNTTGMQKGNYIINATATQVQYETDTTDNTKAADSMVKIGVPGDLNSDNTCDLLDLVLVATKFGTVLGDPRYDPNYDFNNDNMIDLLDLVKVALHFGETDP